MKCPDRDIGDHSLARFRLGVVVGASMLAVAALVVASALHISIKQRQHVADSFLWAIAKNDVAFARSIVDGETVRMSVVNGTCVIVVRYDDLEVPWPPEGVMCDTSQITASLLPQPATVADIVRCRLMLGKPGAIMNGRLKLQDGKIRFTVD